MEPKPTSTPTVTQIAQRVRVPNITTKESEDLERTFSAAIRALSASGRLRDRAFVVLDENSLVARRIAARLRIAGDGPLLVGARPRIDIATAMTTEAPELASMHADAFKKLRNAKFARFGLAVLLYRDALDLVDLAAR